jgi:hypothetical protein
MESIQHYHAMEAFCRQRSKMEGESELFWLTEAEILVKLATNAQRMKVITEFWARKNPATWRGRRC